ncbi:MAG: 16S rRNA (uracil(1498)-N(3))-methyltransferase [Eubacteriales bacterium]|nr:16S rRNA (uracil(1498)-N(3))-methyltransferase [Eubacteriales bacterium]
MVRFFVESGAVAGKALTLTGENAQHARVLRLREGEEALVCDGRGREWLCRVADASCWDLEVLEERASETEARVAVSVYMAFPKADKLEHVIQKATELGACEIVAFPSARCVSRPDEKGLGKKLDRWQKIAASAAQQSGRGRIPQVLTLPSFAAALERAAQADKALMFYEHEEALTLKAALSEGSYGTVSLLTGPEGGLEEKEVDQARAAGLQVCTLGKRILRCETAPLCALSAVMYDAGEF